MKIAIIGATGLVGQTMLKILDEHGFTKNNEIILYASEKSSGTILSTETKSYIVRKLAHDTIEKDLTFALFSAGSSVSQLWAKEFIKNGTIVIDNSNAFRRNKNVPLVVPEINANEINLKTKLISNPNCSTILLSLPIHTINKVYKIKRIIVSTYQATSGAGKRGIDDLINNTTNKFPYKIQNNLIPEIGTTLSNGYTLEEDKLSYEIKKIINKSSFTLSATAVRVPIKNCHSESVNIEFYSPININNIIKILSSTKGISCSNNISLPMPLLSDGKDEIFVGRVRKDYSTKNAINLFLCGDNIRKGAALNAIEIMEYILKTYY